MIPFPKPPTGTSPQAAWYRQILDAVMRRNVLQIEGYNAKETTDGRVFQKVFGVTPVSITAQFPFQITPGGGENLFKVNGGAVEVRIYFDNTSAAGVYDINKYQNLLYVGNPPYGLSTDSIYNPILDLTAAFNGGVAGAATNANIYLTIAQSASAPTFQMQIQAFPEVSADAIPVNSSGEAFNNVASYSALLIGKVLNPNVISNPPANWTNNNPGSIIQCVRTHITGQYFTNPSRLVGNTNYSYYPQQVYFPGDIITGSDNNAYILISTSPAGFGTAPDTGGFCSLGIDPTVAAANNYWVQI